MKTPMVNGDEVTVDKKIDIGGKGGKNNCARSTLRDGFKTKKDHGIFHQGSRPAHPPL